MNRRKRARLAAKAEIADEPTFCGSIDRYIERLDEYTTIKDDRLVYSFRDLKYSTLRGAVRAAARELGRYDKAKDEIKK